MKKLSVEQCVSCASTGLLRAELKENEEGRFISVVVCNAHSHEKAEKTILDMQNASNLNVEVASVEKPTVQLG